MSAARAVLDRLWRHNPLYLASAASMLAACYLLTGADSRDTSGVGHVLPILGWATSYEAALIGFGAFLWRRGLARDARTLLVIEAVFLADFTNLTAETIAFSPRWGWTTAALLLLTAGKITFACAAYRLRPRWAELGWSAGLLAAILLLPSLGRELARHSADLQVPLYGVAWLLGAFLVIAALRENEASSPLVAALQWLLPLSLAAHLIALHWQYGVPFYPANLSPVLLAATVRLVRSTGALAPAMRAALPLLAVIFALGSPGSFVLDLGPLPWFSPTRGTAFVAVVILLYDYRRSGQIAPAAVGLSGIAAGGLLYNLDAILRLVDVLFHAATSSLPRTRRQWGALALLSAWALLIVAGWISLTGRRNQRSEMP